MPFPCRSPRRPLQHCAKATSVFVRRTFSYMPCGNKVPEDLQQGEGLAGFHPPFPFPLAAEALATLRKSHVGLRPTHFFVYKPLRKQSSRGTYIRKKPNLKLGFCLCCGERGIRTPGTVTRTPHFECGPIDHSGISPICSDSFSPFTFRPFGLRVSRSPQPDSLKDNQQGSLFNGVQR